MKMLSIRQASRCEEAKMPRCRCRCGGRLHGAKRGVDVTALPSDDPHAVRPLDRAADLGAPAAAAQGVLL